MKTLNNRRPVYNTLVLLLVWCVITINECAAQDQKAIDSLKSEILKLNTKFETLAFEQEYVRHNVSRFHAQHRLGVMIMLSSLVLGISEFALTDNTFEKGKPAFLYINSGVMITGMAFTIDSYRHLGKAGKRSIRATH